MVGQKMETERMITVFLQCLRAFGKILIVLAVQANARNSGPALKIMDITPGKHDLAIILVRLISGLAVKSMVHLSVA